MHLIKSEQVMHGFVGQGRKLIPRRLLSVRELWTSRIERWTQMDWEERMERLLARHLRVPRER